MSLSKENAERLNTNYLYKKEIPPRDIDKYPCGPCWCRNWTYRCKGPGRDGNYYMYDTYYDDWDSAILVTDENINDFEVVFDFREVKRIHDGEADEYNEKDLFCVATDSGGYSCGGLYWVKNDAVKSKDRLIHKQQNEIESLKRQLKWAEEELERLQQ